VSSKFKGKTKKEMLIIIMNAQLEKGNIAPEQISKEYKDEIKKQ